MSFPSLQCRIEPALFLHSSSVAVDVLRLDLLHPVVSGNKWFKLKEYVKEAKATGKTTLLTFGGAYSNHIVATAAVAQSEGFKSIGIIRGEEPKTWSQTLLAAKQYGMNLHFVSRKEYKLKEIPTGIYSNTAATDFYGIPEGGYGEKGVQGAREILLRNKTNSYTHILSAVGTGTTLAGLVSAAEPQQKVIGIPVLKNAFSLQQEIEALLPADKREAFTLVFDYHFGGYAKHLPQLLQFMNEFYSQTKIPTDFVYTGKAFFAAFDLLAKNVFPPGSKLLLIHTGGLQGNLSLKKSTLIF